MEKTEKAYREAVTALDAAVKIVRKRHNDAVAELTRAQDKVKQYGRISALDTKTRLEAECAELRLKAIKEDFTPKIRNIWKDYDFAASQIRRDLAAVLEEADTLHASNLDPAAVALLNSGTMKVRDYQAMIDDFSENSTVLALVRKAARDAAEKMTDPQQGTERGMLLAVADKARTDSERFMNGFDELSSVVKMFSHRDSFGNFESYGEMLSTSALDGWETVTAGIIPSDEAPSDDGE